MRVFATKCKFCDERLTTMLTYHKRRVSWRRVSDGISQEIFDFIQSDFAYTRKSIRLTNY